MKIVKKLNEAAENVNSIKTSDLWVVQTYYGSDIYHVFTKKEDAEIEKERYSKEYYDYYRKVNKRMTDDEFENNFEPVMKKIKVMTLEDAIDSKIESAIEDATDPGEDY